MRYIESNPVKAGITEDISSYAWSSFQHTGKGVINKIINNHQVYESLGRDISETQSIYRNFCQQDIW
jgi:putative transposase